MPVWIAFLILRLCKSLHMPGRNIPAHLFFFTHVGKNTAVSRTHWDYAGKRIFICENGSWRLTPALIHMHQALTPNPQIPALTKNHSSPPCGIQL